MPSGGYNYVLVVTDISIREAKILKTELLHTKGFHSYIKEKEAMEVE